MNCKQRCMYTVHCTAHFTRSVQIKITVKSKRMWNFRAKWKFPFEFETPCRCRKQSNKNQKQPNVTSNYLDARRVTGATTTNLKVRFQLEN